MSAYLPIAEHGVIGDLHSVALVGTDGTIDWFCCPRFDSPSVFASILDAEKGGFYRIAPANDGHTTKQLYFPDTNVLITRFLTPDGVGEVHDFMPIHRDPRHAAAAGAAGGGRARARCASRSSAGRGSTTAASAHELELHDGGAVFHSPELLADARDQRAARAPRRRRRPPSSRSRTAQSATFVLQQTEPGQRLRPISEAAAAESFNAHRALLARLALALGVPRPLARDGEPLGADAQAAHLPRRPARSSPRPTTSLPEHVGGERNWDYRYTWVRDAAFSLYALLRLGLHRGGRGVHDAGSPTASARRRLRRGRPAPDHVRHRRPRRPHRGGARPPRGLRAARRRCGSATAPPTQLQLDIYGELIDSVYLYNKYGEPISYDSWIELRKIVEWLCDNWDQPDEGIWETRGGRQDFTYSRLMSLGRDRAGGAHGPLPRPARPTWSSGSRCATRSPSRS